MAWQVGYGGKQIDEGYFTRKEFFVADTSGIEQFTNRFKNIDVYKSTFYYEVCFHKKLLYGDFYLDFDASIESNDIYCELKRQVCNTYTSIKKDYNLTDNHIAIYFSGSKGFHITINGYNLGFVPKEKLNEEYKKLALHYRQQSDYIDTKIYDDRRLFRIPNSINSKTGLYKVMITYNQLKNLTYEEICKFASSKQKIVNKQLCSKSTHLQNKETTKNLIKKIDTVIQAKVKTYKRNYNKSYVKDLKLSPCIVNMINDIHGEGERNTITAIIGSAFFQFGCEFEDVYDYLCNWNIEHFKPSLDEIEIYKTLMSVKNRVDNDMKYGCTSIIELGYCVPKCIYNNLSERIDLYEATFGH